MMIEISSCVGVFYFSMNELRQINEAFLNAYDIDSLTRLTFFEFEEDIHAVASGGDFTSIVFRLTRWAERNGKLRQLVEAAKEDNPNNAQLQALDVPLLRETVLVNNSSEVLDNQVVSLEILDYRIQQLQAEINRISIIVSGPDGTNGVNSLSKKNERDIQEIVNTVRRLENAISKAPDLFASRSSKVIFGFILVLLSATALIVAGGAFGFI